MQKDLLERYTTILSYKKKDIKGVFKKVKIFNYQEGKKKLRYFNKYYRGRYVKLAVGASMIVKERSDFRVKHLCVMHVR